MSRLFGIIKPDVLWQGPLSLEFRKAPAEVRELASCLLTAPEGSVWGIWRWELEEMRLRLGPGRKIAETWATLNRIGFARWDPASSFVYVPDMPRMQHTRYPLVPKDKMVAAAKRWYLSLPENPWLGDWWDRHRFDLYLDRPLVVEKRVSGSEQKETEGASMPHSPDPAPDPVTAPGFDLLGEVAGPPATIKRKLAAAQREAAFDMIAKVFPKKESIEKARIIFAQMNPTSELVAEVMAALEWQVRSFDWIKQNGVFVPRLTSYLKDKRWTDKPRANRPQVNVSTERLVASAADFINGAPESPCTTPARNAHGSHKRLAR